MPRLRLIGLLLAAVLAVGGLAPVAAAPATLRSPRYYLALGDSLPFGYQQARIERLLDRGWYDPDYFISGYPNLLMPRLGAAVPGIRLVNYSCPGENDVTFATTGSSYGVCSFLHESRLDQQQPEVAAAPLHDNWEGVKTRPQLDGALEFLAEHRGEVRLITFQVFSDDVLTLLYDTCEGDPTCALNGHDEIWSTARENLSASIAQLRAAAPDAELIVPNYYGTQGVDESLDAIVPTYNRVLAEAAKANGAPVADVYTPFDDGNVCSLTLLCTRDEDYHATTRGYALMAQTIWETSSFGR